MRRGMVFAGRAFGRTGPQQPMTEADQESRALERDRVLGSDQPGDVLGVASQQLQRFKVAAVALPPAIKIFALCCSRGTDAPSLGLAEHRCSMLESNFIRFPSCDERGDLPDAITRRAIEVSAVP